jgi:hypothetical protein
VEDRCKGLSVGATSAAEKNRNNERRTKEWNLGDKPSKWR